VKTSDEPEEVHAMWKFETRKLPLYTSRETDVPRHGRLKEWQRMKNNQRKKGERKRNLLT
jgi:hypothetical protein